MEDVFDFDIGDLESILWQPVLSIPSDVKIPESLLDAVNAKATNTAADAVGLQSYIIVSSGLCYKRKSIALFGLAAKLLSEKRCSSCLWLDSDRRGPARDLHLEELKIQLSPEIHIFLQQAGFHLSNSAEDGFTYPESLVIFQNSHLKAA